MPLALSLVLSAHLDDVIPLPLAVASKILLERGEWFPLDILLKDNRIHVLVKGKSVLDYTDTNATFTTGRLGLVCRGKAMVKFRNLEIKEE